MNKLTISLLGIILVIAATSGTWYVSQKHGSEHTYAEMHQKHHGSKGMHQQHQHDEVNMPGLIGRDTSEQEVNDLKTLFQKHAHITREVTYLENGIMTSTESSNPEVKAAIVRHVSMMIGRFEAGRNPKVMIQSPTLDALFDVNEQIDTQIESSATGVMVTQTSKNNDVVALLHKHATEVSEMSAKGMRAVHERMANNEQMKHNH